MIRRMQRKKRNEKSENTEGFHGMDIIRFARPDQIFPEKPELQGMAIY